MSIASLDLDHPHARADAPNVTCWIDFSAVAAALREKLLRRIDGQLQAAMQPLDDESVHHWMARGARLYLASTLVKSLLNNAGAKVVGTASLKDEALVGNLEAVAAAEFNELMDGLVLRRPRLDRLIPSEACVSGWVGLDLSLLNSSSAVATGEGLQDGPGIGHKLLRANEFECAFWSVRGEEGENVFVVIRTDDGQALNGSLSRVLPAGWSTQLKNGSVWLTWGNDDAGKGKASIREERFRVPPGTLAAFDVDFGSFDRILSLASVALPEELADELRAFEAKLRDPEVPDKASTTLVLSVEERRTTARLVCEHRACVLLSAFCLHMLDRLEARRR